MASGVGGAAVGAHLPGRRLRVAGGACRAGVAFNIVRRGEKARPNPAQILPESFARASARTRPGAGRGAGEVGAVGVHDLAPGRHAVLDEPRLRGAPGRDFGQGAQRRVRPEHEVDAGAGPLDDAGGAGAEFEPASKDRAQPQATRNTFPLAFKLSLTLGDRRANGACQSKPGQHPRKSPAVMRRTEGPPHLGMNRAFRPPFENTA
jgi:hypothetical protein